jgi:hypothetical protein
MLAPRPTPQAGEPPLSSCPRLLIQYISSYLPYLETVTSIRDLKTRHAVVIETHITTAKRNFPVLRNANVHHKLHKILTWPIVRQFNTVL